MIESVHIEDLGVIQEADLAFGPGLTALTGETGAGKTLVLTSLGLLLGQRSESTVVRPGASRALVEGTFVLTPGGRAADRAVQAGAELDGDLLIASRTVPAQGRSRAHLGGRSVPSAVLAEVGSGLVSVHGQADQLRLRSSAAQRAALDQLGGAEHARRCRDYATAFRAWREAAAALARWQEGAAGRAAEAERLRAWLEELEQLDPRPGEDAALEAEAARLDHAEDLRRAVSRARGALSADEASQTVLEPDVVALAAGAERALDTAASLDPALGDLAAQVRQIGILAADAASELGDYLASLDADPVRLSWVQDRRSALRSACQRIGGPQELEDVDALLAWGRQASARLDQLDGPQDAGTRLRADLTGARQELEQAAADLTGARQELAEQLEAAVTAELEGLQMRGARLVVELTPLAEPGPTGAETVALLLAAHPGAPALPLGKGASGGELSRIMLALEVVLAQSETDPQEAGRGGPAHGRTFVFDEVDAGVGGRAALEVGRRLARLARSHQVVVVTHLAQVAAWASTQLVVLKEVDAARGGAPTTSTRVVPVTGQDRVRELARMLSGHEDSEAALRHAAELLAEAGVAESLT